MSNFTTALITGGAGFIGSHLVEALLSRGRHVIVVDDLSTGRMQNLKAVLDHPRFEHHVGSAEDTEYLRSVLPRVQEIYHLAAAVGVRLVADMPIESIYRNVLPNRVLFETILQESQECKIFLASSSEVYGKNPHSQWNESADLVFGRTDRPRWSYGIAKALGEFLALAYWRDHQVPVVIGRFFNVVGPRQLGNYGMVLPRFVNSALKGEPLTVHDDGQQVRCFAHVKDVVNAVISLMETPNATGQVFNIGSDQGISIQQLAERVISHANPHATIKHVTYQQAYADDFEDVRDRVPDLSKLQSAITFQPQHSLDDIIQDVTNWMKSEDSLELS